MPEKPFVTQLAEDLAKDTCSLSESMRKARLAAHRLGVQGVSKWIDAELKGYGPADELPSYRQKQGLLQGYNPYHGWQPVMSEDREFIKKISRAPIGSPIAVIESDVRTADDGKILEFSLPPETRNAFSLMLNVPTNVRLLLPPSTPLDILEAVRNLLTDWCLELEKSGVLGEGLTFGDLERAAAPGATERFVVNNYGTIGNIVGEASQTAVSANVLTTEMLSSVKALTQQVSASSSLLPAEIRSTVTTINSELAAEADKTKPDSSRLRELGASLRKVTESATGNLAAQGILTMLRSIFGA